MNMMTDIPPFEIKNAFKDWRAAYFQDDIRRAMLASIPRSEPKASRSLHEALPAVRDAIRKYLAEFGPSARHEIVDSTRLDFRQVDRALRTMRDLKQVACRRMASVNRYAVTAEGLAALGDKTVVTAKPKNRLPPAAATIEAVYDFLLLAPATRAEIVAELEIAESTLDGAFRVLRQQGRLVALDDRVGQKYTYGAAVPKGVSLSDGEVRA